jgi:hypothetical protein
MSRTFSHTPPWVAENREGVISHDHSEGVCEIAPPVRSWPVGGWRVGWRSIERGRRAHYRKCLKYTKFTMKCTHSYRTFVEPYSHIEELAINAIHKFEVFDSDGVRTDPGVDVSIACGAKPRDASVVIDKETADFYFSYSYHYSIDQSFVVDGIQFGHHLVPVIIYDKNTPCSCDDFPPRATCYRYLDYAGASKYFKSWKSEYYGRGYTKNKLRATLGEMRDCYNAHDENGFDELLDKPVLDRMESEYF